MYCFSLVPRRPRKGSFTWRAWTSGHETSAACDIKCFITRIWSIEYRERSEGGREGGRGGVGKWKGVGEVGQRGGSPATSPEGFNCLRLGGMLVGHQRHVL